jgi:hypothetical protein
MAMDERFPGGVVKVRHERGGRGARLYARWRLLAAAAVRSTWH